MGTFIQQEPDLNQNQTDFFPVIFRNFGISDCINFNQCHQAED